MTEQELRDTIVKHIVRLNNVCKTNAVCKDCKYADYDRCTEYAIADALIAAGIGDVKDVEAEANRYEMLYKLQNRDMALAERRAHDVEHRAEVAERALDKATEKVIQFLTMFKAMGFEVIKSNYGQTALNTVNSDMPMVLNNDVGYMTPLPNKWEFIDDEIKRLQKELLEEREKDD